MDAPRLIRAIIREALGTKSFRKRELARNKRLGFKAEDWIKIKLKDTVDR